MSICLKLKLTVLVSWEKVSTVVSIRQYKLGTDKLGTSELEL